MRILFLSCALALAGCASYSGVVPAGQDTYLVSRQAASGFSGLGTLKADALREADTYCQGLHKMMKVVSATEAKPPYILGNFHHLVKALDRKSTRLNSSHTVISYAVFCLK